MIIRTRQCFHFLLKILKPKIVCDIGSMDGMESLKFRSLLPNARIIAFEANPDNFYAIKNNPKIDAANIELSNKAVSNNSGQTKFYIENRGDDAYRKGISSLKQRTENSLGSKEIIVDTIRLDEFINTNNQSIALWIDTEGAGYDVLSGIKGVSKNVVLIHIEVEQQMYWKDQHLAEDICSIASSYGFFEIGRGNGDTQFDIVFLNSKFEKVSGILKFVVLFFSRTLGLLEKIKARFSR